MKQILTLKEPIGQVREAKDIFEKIQSINIDFAQENLVVIYLNTKSQIIDTEVLFKGGLNTCFIDPRTIFRNALLKNSFSIITAHNHPSRSLEPSNEDITVFEKLKTAADTIGIQLLDNIIFNEREFYSLSNH